MERNEVFPTGKFMIYILLKSVYCCSCFVVFSEGFLESPPPLGYLGWLTADELSNKSGI